MTKVKLREKKLKHGKLSLYLDFYPPITNPKTNKPTRREHLKLYVYGKPKNELEKNHNKETRMLGDSIRSKRQLDIQAGDYGFLARNENEDFLKFYQSIVDEKKSKSDSTWYRWKNSRDHFINFFGNECKFKDVTEKLAKNYKEYLLHDLDLAQNTASAYYLCFLKVCRTAAEEKLFAENPAKKIKNIPEVEVEREYLTLEELQRLAQTPFRFEGLRRAALFAALTGLRRSDILKLTWSEVVHDKDVGYYLKFRQKKTDGFETHPISEEAFDLCGERREGHKKVFYDFKKHHGLYLPMWLEKAGIDRNITFHCFRHTYSVLQLNEGTDIYLLSKLLGHKDIRATQIYAKIVDSRKRETVNKIKLK